MRARYRLTCCGLESCTWAQPRCRPPYTLALARKDETKSLQAPSHGRHCSPGLSPFGPLAKNNTTKPTQPQHHRQLRGNLSHRQPWPRPAGPPCLLCSKSNQIRILQAFPQAVHLEREDWNVWPRKRLPPAQRHSYEPLNLDENVERLSCCPLPAATSTTYRPEACSATFCDFE